MCTDGQQANGLAGASRRGWGRAAVVLALGWLALSARPAAAQISLSYPDTLQLLSALQTEAQVLINQIAFGQAQIAQLQKAPVPQVIAGAGVINNQNNPSAVAIAQLQQTINLRSAQLARIRTEIIVTAELAGAQKTAIDLLKRLARDSFLLRRAQNARVQGPFRQEEIMILELLIMTEQTALNALQKRIIALQTQLGNLLAGG